VILWKAIRFKGTVSRDGGRDEPMEQFSPKLRFANPPFLNYGPQSSASIDIKSGFKDPADFAITRSLIDCELSKLFQGSGSEQKDPDPNGLGSISLTYTVYGSMHHTCISAKNPIPTNQNQSIICFP
jgi:hypothetical protein